MTHHVCTQGCGGVAETPGTCQTADCSGHGQPLTECNCEDSLHAEVLKKSEGEETSDTPTEKSGE